MRFSFLCIVVAIATGLFLVYYILRSSVFLSPPLHQPLGDSEQCVSGRCSRHETVKLFKHMEDRLADLAVDSLGLDARSSSSLLDEKKSLPGQQLPDQPACGNTSQDILSPIVHTALHFLPNSKNPCWKNTEARESTASPLSCLPYFFLAGVSKCGSTDIFSRLSQHLQVIPPAQKEPCWFDKKRFHFDRYPFQWYISNFKLASSKISQDLQNFGTSKKIVGDGSPTYFWRNIHWNEFAGNERCLEPRFVIPDVIQRLLPQAKVIFSFRNPVNSIYSKYLSEANKGVFRSPEHFHSLVETEITRYQHCFAHFSIRSCAYNLTLTLGTELRLEKGLYAIFLADWFRVFSRQQIHIIHFENYIMDIAGHLQRMFEFLELEPMSEKELDDVASLPPSNRGQHYSIGAMLPATQRMLVQFYAPFNSKLAELLEDKRFLWPSSVGAN